MAAGPSDERRCVFDHLARLSELLDQARHPSRTVVLSRFERGHAAIRSSSSGTPDPVYSTSKAKVGALQRRCAVGCAR